MENKVLNSIGDLLTDKKFAVGNDLVFIPDFELSFNDLFKNKVYTQNEIAYCDQFDNSILRYASTWAAKEAVYKAIKQIDHSTLGWNKIEITREKIAGQPRVTIHKDFGIPPISLTISHDGDYVWAVAFIENNIK
jgi:holo-[acyl-carrier protein] synthase